MAELLHIPIEDRVSLQVRDLTVTTKNNSAKVDEEAGPTKSSAILNKVSFDVEAGSMMAIMGGSGSGKTTLLNTLSGRMNARNKNLDFDGFINYSSPNAAAQLVHVTSAYLLQSDHFLPGLTVLETLKFQAALRIWPGTSQERLELIQLLLDKLELNHLTSTLVVDFTHKIHLSGGERRRLSLAIQLLSRPKVLFLDEPTTGLDLSSSLKLIRLLQKFCLSQGITVILSIHQPRLEITNMFDNICLLTRGGKVIYYGNIVDSQDYFNDLIPLGISSNYSNFIDYIIDLSVKNTSTEQTELATADRIKRLVENWSSTTAFNDNVSEQKKNQLKTLESVILGDKSPIPFYHELFILTQRSFITSYRDKLSVFSLIVGGSFLALLCGWIFFRPTPDLAGIRSLTSVLYVMLEVIGFSPLFIELERLCYIDGPNYARERKDNLVSPLGFLLSRRLGKLFLEDLPTSILFGIITFYMWGLNSGTRQFFIYLVFTVINYLTGVSLAMVAYAAATTFPLSIVIVNITYQAMNLGCGYFINAATMPVYVRWVKYIAYFYYSMEGLASNQFTDWYGKCPDDNPHCSEMSGASVLRDLGFRQNYVNIPIVIMVAFTIGFQIIAWLQLLFKASEMGMVKVKRNKIGGSADDRLLLGDKEEADPSIVDQELMNFDLDNKEDLTTLELNLVDVTLSLKGGPNGLQVLLDNVLAHFKGSGLNAIMGPSGSGKTTLLNYLTNRLSTKMKIEELTGSLYLNEYLVKDTKALMKISSIVPQQDYLLPTLTVRETLYYQAKLRLPLNEHENIPNLISSLIRKTGLTDCADLMVGNEDVKGISGGEKRRLTIAIQLLNRSKVLFLDEPTSGLDSATATSILKLLKELAQYNDYTIVCTIHQPNQDMLSMFQNILLLGRGGKALFNGAPGKISSYFSSIGYPIVGPNSVLQAAQLQRIDNDGNHSDSRLTASSLNANIADAMLDLIGKQINETLEESQKRVLDLARIWNQEQTKFPLCAKDENEVDRKLFPSHLFEKQRNSMLSQISTLVRRQFVNSIRSFDVLFAKYLLVVLLAVLYVLFFTPLRLTQDGITNRLGLVQEVLLLYYVGLINNLSLYPFERDLFYTEYRDGIYGAVEFMAAYAINEFPAEFLPSAVFSVLCVFSIGLPRTNEMFWCFFLCCFVVILCGESLGIFVNSIFNHLGLATNLLSSLVIVAIFMGGTMSLHLPPFFKVWNFISPLKYASQILMTQIFHDDSKFSCSVGKVTDDYSSCALTSGPIVLETYGFVHALPGYFGGIITCVVVYRAIAVLSVHIRTKYFLR